MLSVRYCYSGPWCISKIFTLQHWVFLGTECFDRGVVLEPGHLVVQCFNIRKMSTELILVICDDSQLMFAIEQYNDQDEGSRDVPRIHKEGLVPGRLCVCQPV